MIKSIKLRWRLLVDTLRYSLAIVLFSSLPCHAETATMTVSITSVSATEINGTSIVIDTLTQTSNGMVNY